MGRKKKQVNASIANLKKCKTYTIDITNIRYNVDPVSINTKTPIPTKASDLKIIRQIEKEGNEYKNARRCISGTYNQGNIEKYSNDAGKQCVPNSLIAIVYTKITDIRSWTSSTLDRILDLGNEYYRHIQTLSHIQHEYLLVNELLNTVELEGKCFKININDNSKAGLLMHSDNDIGISLHEALYECFAIFESCFITFKNNTFAIMKQNSKYFVFDSHGRDANGLVNESGTSVLIEYCTIMDVYIHCIQLSLSMMCSDKEQFEITGINVHNLINVDNIPDMIDAQIFDMNNSDIHITDEDNDITITHQNKTPFTFEPLILNQKIQLCKIFQISVTDMDTYPHMKKCILANPTQYISIKGDGNCFFRSISHTLAGTEEFHKKIRISIVDYMRSHSEHYVGLLPQGYSSIAEYVKQTKMRKLGTWSTEMELFVTADLLQTEIYIFSDAKWLKIPVSHITTKSSSQAIYLNHKDGNHYEVVKNVQRNNNNDINCDINLTHIGKDKQNNHAQHETPSQTNRKRKHRRGHNWTCTKSEAKYKHKNIKTKRENKRYYGGKRKRQIQYLKKRQRQLYRLHNKDQKLRHKYQNELKYHLKQKYILVLRFQLHKKYQHELQELLKQKYRDGLDVQLKKKYRDGLDEHLKQKYLDGLDEKLKQKYRDGLDEKLQQKYRNGLDEKLKHKYIKELKKKLKKKYANELKLKLKQKYINELRIKLKKKYIQIYKEKLQRKYWKDNNFRKKARQKSIHKYKVDIKHRTKLQKSNMKRKEEKNKNSGNISKVLQKFKKDSSEGPIYVCSVCNRLLFSNQVKKCHEESYEKKTKKVQMVAKMCITKTYFHECNDYCLDTCSYSENYKSLWICFTCHRKILQGKTPAESIVNNMHPGLIPNELNCLNQLEKHLIAKNIVFLKMIQVSPQNDQKLIGETVCVPSNLSEMTNVLPRCRNDDEIIRVKLKKKLSNKGHYKFQTITKNHIKNALKYLKHHNSNYTDVVLNKEWEEEQDNNLSVLDNLINNNTEDTSSNDTNSDSDLDMVDENIGRYTCDTTGSSCLQPVDISANIMNNADNIFSISPAENNRPVRLLMDKTNEACTFPFLFPKGNNTFSEYRDIPITLGKYLKNRLMSADTRFAACTEYLFYAQYIYELQQILSGTAIALRQGRMGGNLITAEMLTHDEPLQNIIRSDAGFTFMRNCRGSPAFWQATQKDLFAMIRQLGIPTFFLSFSCSELRFESFLTTILQQQGSNIQVKDLNWMQKRELLRSNPVTITRLFDQRFKLFLKTVLLDSNVIGKVVDYFFRSEIQSRGAIHLHGIVYIANAPKLDIDSDEKVVEFIDKYISCALPNEKEDPEMFEIVSNVQRHSKKHSKSCRKNKKTCRFNFPRPPSDRTFICRTQENIDQQENENENLNSTKKCSKMCADQAKAILELLWKELNSEDKSYDTLSNLYNEIGLTQDLFEQACAKLTRKTYIVHKRNVTDSWINQYNPNMLKAWNANLDIQYVIDAYACVVYIVSYITKAEKEMGMLLRETYKEAKQNNMDAKSCMRKISTTYLHSREVSGPESALRVLGLPLKRFSRKVQFIPTGNNNIKITLPLKELQRRAKDGTLSDAKMFMVGWVERYLARPKANPFNDMCIGTFCSEYRLMSTSENPKVTSVKNPAFELQNDLGYIIKRSRTSPAIIRYARFSMTKNPENYYLSNLQLFLPYRFEAQLKPPGFETHEEFYKSGSVKISNEIEQVRDIVERNRKQFETDIDIDSLQEIIQKSDHLEDAWARIAPETEQDRIETELYRAENNEIDEECTNEPQIPDLISDKGNSDRIRRESNITGISKSEATPLLRSLNCIQTRIFYKIRQYCLDKVHGKNPEPFRLFITGSAGTGKSHLIKCIKYEAARIMEKMADNIDDVTVLLTAPTGVSAFNISASTIHSSFSIRKGFSFPPYQPLGNETINTLRCKYRNLQILIIDEISMVDHKLLCYIHGRLGQIKGTDDTDLFGNICIICFGDMWQLKPVKASSLCHDSVIDIWNGQFKLVELTEIMRQRGDLDFAQTLNRIRKRKKGEKLLQTDIELLQSRVTGVEDDCLHIFSTNEQVNAYNSNMITKKCPNAISIYAKDYSKDARSGKMQLKDHCAKATDTPLIELLQIGIDSNIMLVVNLDVSIGLINGSFGKVTYIENDNNNQPIKIYVKFDHAKLIPNSQTHLPPFIPKGSIPIERHESSHINHKGDIRRQFPLRLAYAVTIHKVQGLSLDRAVISLNKIFQAGQAYVALSRVKTLNGLTIQDFNEKTIYCDEKIEKAVNKMPLFLQPEEEPRLTDCSIILFNIQGLKTHIADLKTDQRILKADIICLTETWLSNVGKPANIRLDDFTLYNHPRSASYNDSQQFKFIKEKEHGGVAVYHRRNMCNIINLGLINIEHVAFNVPHKNISIITIYRPPMYRLELFIPQLQTLLNELHDSGHDYIVMGDFNENLLEGFSSIKNKFNDYGYTQIVTESTTEGNSCIDHIYVKGIDLQRMRIAIIPTYYSYHEAIKIILS